MAARQLLLARMQALCLKAAKAGGLTSISPRVAELRCCMLGRSEVYYFLVISTEIMVKSYYSMYSICFRPYLIRIKVLG